MAIVLDINMLCNKMPDLNEITMLLSQYRVSIESMNSIDNWMWDNEKKIEDPKQITTILDMQQIVTINLKQPSIKDIGIYIEKIDSQFLYTLWINTEGYPKLDCEKITRDNCEFYKKIIWTILELNGVIEDFFEVAGIGLETDFCYEKNIIDIIRKSKNMMIWMLNKCDESNTQIEGFKGDMIEGVYILQRK